MSAADPRPQALVKAHVGKAAGVSAGALALACGFIATHEGEVRHAYVDRLGKGQPLTACYGNTIGVTNRSYTHQECVDMLKTVALQHAEDAAQCLPEGLPDETAAAFYSLSYNLGAKTFCKSSMSRKAFAGDLPGACDSILLYVWSGGKDCRDPKSGCRGIVKRREDERALCLSGLNKAPVPQPIPETKPEHRSWISSLLHWLRSFASH